MALAVVTGASSGIGSQFARQLSHRGYDLVLVARNKEKLTNVADKCRTRCEIVIADLSKEAECKKLLKYLESKSVDLFINNAGFGNIGLFEENDLDRDIQMIDTNVRAVHILTHGILKQMKKADKGYILNTASLAGLMPGGPLMATYYATKAYVVSMTNGIDQELKYTGSNVKISALCPGPVDTEFNDIAGVKFSLGGISARKCVINCLKDMKKGKVIIIPSLLHSIAAVLGRALPMSFVMSFVLKAQRKKIEGDE